MSGPTGRVYPWGAGRPPALACDLCRKRIGARRRHFADADRTHVFCGPCFVGRGRELHARFYPDCAHGWHDSTHGVHFATRFSMWFALRDPEAHRDESDPHGDHESDPHGDHESDPHGDHESDPHGDHESDPHGDHELDCEPLAAASQCDGGLL